MPYYRDRFVDQIVILTGAGVSAESGLATFRDNDGLWENHDPMAIATPEALARDPELVLGFYNARRAQLSEVAPNAAHQAIARLQAHFPGEVFLVTQNVDDLHERGGSAQVCHMHGELLGMLCSHCGRQSVAKIHFDVETACTACGTVGSLRPDIVFFGEMPYHMDRIETRLSSCSLFLAIGTSGAVYPAAGFVRHAAMAGATCVELSKEPSDVAGQFHHHLTGPATETVVELVEQLLQ